jgi:hypothetical protein
VFGGVVGDTEAAVSELADQRSEKLLQVGHLHLLWPASRTVTYEDLPGSSD